MAPLAASVAHVVCVVGLEGTLVRLRMNTKNIDRTDATLTLPGAYTALAGTVVTTAVMMRLAPRTRWDLDWCIQPPFDPPLRSSGPLRLSLVAVHAAAARAVLGGRSQHGSADETREYLRCQRPRFRDLLFATHVRVGKCCPARARHALLWRHRHRKSDYA